MQKSSRLKLAVPVTKNVLHLKTGLKVSKIYTVTVMHSVTIYE